MLGGIGEQLAAQNVDKFFEAADKITQHAQEGTGNATAKPLIKAIKLLIENPSIRSLNFEKKPLEEDYFNPRSMITLAQRYAKQKPRLLKKLNRLEHKLNIVEPEGSMGTMAPDPKNIRIPSADFIHFKQAENQKEMSFRAPANQLVIMEFKSGEDIGIRIFEVNAAPKPIAESSGSDIKQTRFNVKRGRTYLVELYRTDEKAALLRLASFTEPQ